jgi:hypothetical protein
VCVPIKRGGVVASAIETLAGLPFFGRQRPTFAREFLSLDTETVKFSDDEPVPPLVCLQTYDPREGVPKVVGYRDASAEFLRLAKKAIERDAVIIGHNLAFDVAALVANDPKLWPLMWRLYDLGLFEDSLIVEKLDAIARGQMDEDSSFTRWVSMPKSAGGGRANLTYNLADCVRYRFGIEIPKGEETWRTRYGELREVPVSQWPGDAYKYAADDPVHAWTLRMQQEKVEAESPAMPGEYAFADAPAQSRAGFALFLQRWMGVSTDPRHVPVVRAELEALVKKHEAGLIKSGLLRAGYVRPKAKDWKPPSQNAKLKAERVAAAYVKQGLPVPRNEPTEKMQAKGIREGNIKADADALAVAALVDPELLLLKQWIKAQKNIQFLSALAQGYDHPIHTEPNVLVATGRTSWGSTNPEGDVDEAKRINLQNLPKYPGIRESYIPPPGFYFFSIDYNQLELCALAWVCKHLVGYSRMLDLINSGIDLHTTLACQFLGIPYEEGVRLVKAEDAEFDAFRQLAKAANFGFPGGMGVAKFIITARKQDEKKKFTHLLVEETVKRLKDTWLATFPELRVYFKLADGLAKSGKLVQMTSGRVRDVGTSKNPFCTASNSLFQGLAADGAKEAMYLVQRMMWGDPNSPAYGGWLVAFVHDEFVGCVPADRASEAVDACYNVVMDAMRRRMPGVLIKGSKTLMLRWRKKAPATYDASGKLIPFEHGAEYRKLLDEGKIWDDRKCGIHYASAA